MSTGWGGFETERRLSSTTTLWLQDTPLPNRGTYYFQVRSVDKAGRVSPWAQVGPVQITWPADYSYTYYPTGDRKTQTRFGIAYTYSYSNSGLLTSVTYGSTREDFSDDANGNQTKRTITKSSVVDEVWEYEYDQINQLNVVYRTKGQGSRNWVAKYIYDPDGLRVRTVVNATQTSPGWTTIHIYDGLNVVYEEVFEGVTDPQASLATLTPNRKVSYVYAGSQRIAEVETDAQGTTRQYFYVTDHLGSTRRITDEQGNTVASMAYEPFGQLLDAAGATGDEAYKFTGKPYDDPTGLYYYGARFYDPAIGRFITQDPAQDGLNWYAYCNNNPLAYVDPDGRAPSRSQACSPDSIVGFVRQFEESHQGVGKVGLLAELSSAFKDAPDIAHQPDTRYVYTEERGWLDMQHFFEAAHQTTRYGSLATVAGGFWVELKQKGKPSYFSYEDVPSNFAGSDFGTMVFTQSTNEAVRAFFGDSMKKNLWEMLRDFLAGEKAKRPEEAPNWGQLDEDADRKNAMSRYPLD